MIEREFHVLRKTGVTCSQSITDVSLKCEEFGFACVLSLGLQM